MDDVLGCGATWAVVEDSLRSHVGVQEEMGVEGMWPRGDCGGGPVVAEPLPPEQAE